MGNPISKHFLDKDKKSDACVVYSDKQEDVSYNELDPRSPNIDIARTPLQVHSPGKRVQQKITKQVDLSKKLSMLSVLNTEEQSQMQSGSLLRKRLLEELDPRSPSATIVRTPMLLPTHLNELESSEETLKQLDNSILELTEKSKRITEDDNGEEHSDISEKVTDILPLKPLLETHLDYLETDLDNVNINAPSSVTSDNTDSPHALGEDDAIVTDDTLAIDVAIELVTDGLDPRSPTMEIIRTPIVLQETDKLQNACVGDSIDEDPRSPSNFIDRTPIVLPNNIRESSSHLNETDVIEENSEEKKSNLPELQNIGCNTTPHQVTLKNRNKGEANNQIYEDKEHEKLTPRKIIIGDGNRTPLSCVKNKSGFYARSKFDNASVSKKLTEHMGLKIIDNLKSCERPFEGVAARDDENQKVKPKSVNKRTSKIPTLQKKSLENRVINIAKNKLPENNSLKRTNNWDQEKSFLI